MSEPTEDIPYTVDEFAVDHGGEDIRDEDTKLSPQNALVKELRAYIKEQIAKHNSLDVISADAEMIMTTQQQVKVHQEVTAHLRQLQQIINNKVKEN